MPPRPKLLNAEALKEARSDVRQSRDEKRLRKRENTRVSLVRAAADVVAAKGIEGARIDDVVKAAGFTRGAFYSNYSSLDEVLSEAIVERSQALIARIEEAIDGLEGDVTVDVLMDLLASIRPDARSMYLITTEYTLRRMRHPETPEIPVATREEFTATLSGIVEDLLARMGRRPLVPASAVADVVVLFFLDSISQEAASTPSASSLGMQPQDALRLVISAIILGLSVPVDDDAEPAADLASMDPAILTRLAAAASFALNLITFGRYIALAQPWTMCPPL